MACGKARVRLPLTLAAVLDDYDLLNMDRRTENAGAKAN